MIFGTHERLSLVENLLVPDIYKPNASLKFDENVEYY